MTCCCQCAWFTGGCFSLSVSIRSNALLTAANDKDASLSFSASPLEWTRAAVSLLARVSYNTNRLTERHHSEIDELSWNGSSQDDIWTHSSVNGTGSCGVILRQISCSTHGESWTDSGDSCDNTHVDSAETFSDSPLMDRLKIMQFHQTSPVVQTLIPFTLTVLHVGTAAHMCNYILYNIGQDGEYPCATQFS